MREHGKGENGSIGSARLSFGDDFGEMEEEEENIGEQPGTRKVKLSNDNQSSTMSFMQQQIKEEQMLPFNLPLSLLAMRQPPSLLNLLPVDNSLQMLENSYFSHALDYLQNAYFNYDPKRDFKKDLSQQHPDHTHSEVCGHLPIAYKGQTYYLHDQKLCRANEGSILLSVKRS